MKRYNVYKRIQELKERGFRKAAVARQLGINRRTVDKYWDMDADEYNSTLESACRSCQLDEYRDQILGWLQSYKGISASQICDWLKEYYSAKFPERTVSRYVKFLREVHDIPKDKITRDYEAVEDPPMGQQLQVDFGVCNMDTSTGGKVKVYAVAFVLSHSRYKYAELQSRPFTAADLVQSCYRCFQYFGGIPQEMVFDQDSIICVSENSGDIVYTYEFEKFRQETKISARMCRGADPESKGKIENVVKYIKGNFLKNRIYFDDEALNKSCKDWLSRTANAKIHGTTKRIPAEVFAEEQKYLRPLTRFPEASKEKDTRIVRKDNTIVYKSNRYSVPLGTYKTAKAVQIEVRDGILYISKANGDAICEHRISGDRGKLIQNVNHKRDHEIGIDAWEQRLSKKLSGRADQFLSKLRMEKKRYVRDQFRVIEDLITQYGDKAVMDGIRYCEKYALYGATDLRAYVTSKQMEARALRKMSQVPKIPIDDLRFHITTQKRPLSEYAKVEGKQ